MAVCTVIKAGQGWNVGDKIEADGERLKELVDSKVVVVEVSDVIPVPDEVKVVLADAVAFVKEKKKRKAVK